MKAGATIFDRQWVLAKAPPVLITCDEPVVCIGGPLSPRGERAGLSAPVVAFPIAPDRILVMSAKGMAIHNDLSHAEAADLNHEILAASHSLAFELPDRSFTTRAKVPPLTAPIAIERGLERGMKLDDDAEGEVFRVYRPHRFEAEQWRPVPVPRWWRDFE